MARTIEPHIIQKQSIEINFEEMGKAIDVPHRIAELFYERLQPAMDKLFDEEIGKDRVAVVDYLEIDCDVLPAKHWEEEWMDRVIRKLRDELRQINKSPLDRSGKAAEVFFSFLGNGALPWNGFYTSIQELEDLIVINNSFIKRLKESIRSNSNSGKRLMLQFSANFKRRLIISIQETASVNSLQKESSESDRVPAGKLSDTDRLLYQLIEGKKNAIESAENNPPVQKEQVNKRKAEQEPVEELYINNAGLVLLHPFLPVLFDRLGLTKEDKWIDEGTKQRAMLIMQFLASGEFVFPEYDLPLNKILCDCLLNEPVEKEIEVDAITQDACEELLENVIRQWTRLKNTGIEALRETFLQRMGKLSRVNNGWLLQVEQKAVDTLLGGLPWGISVIKLPWMKELLYVEWI